MWFLLIRPQQKQAKKRAEMLTALKAGDKIVTIGGICGVIQQITDNKIFIEILVLFLSAFVLIAGGIMVTINAVGQLSPAMGIPMQFYYVGAPICGVLMIIYSGERLIRFVKELKETKEEK